MREFFLTLIFVVAILSACSSSTVSMSEVENVPNKVQTIIDPNLELQLINDGEKESYIIFHSSGDVEFDFTTQDNTVTINFNENQNDVEEQNTYYLTTDSEYGSIEVLVNGERRPFDNVTGI
ncbi:peptidylprolyl isomerase [Ureibacillus chungkukjangi]|uniref:peptidylprolyl isomerase n=1 Tax=Ureibacillus chungkukjangi TaxID=1202712 RepID=UPI00384F0669